LSERLSARLGQGIEPAGLIIFFFRETRFFQERAAACHAENLRVCLGDSGWSTALSQGREDDAPSTLFVQGLKQSIPHPAVKHAIARLMDQAGCAQFPQNPGSLTRIGRSDNWKSSHKEPFQSEPRDQALPWFLPMGLGDRGYANRKRVPVEGLESYQMWISAYSSR